LLLVAVGFAKLIKTEQLKKRVELTTSIVKRWELTPGVNLSWKHF